MYFKPIQQQATATQSHAQTTLGRVLSLLKDHAQPGHETAADTAFMKLVSKDTGGLKQLLVALAAALQDDYMLSQLDPAASGGHQPPPQQHAQHNSPTVHRIRSKRAQPAAAAVDMEGATASSRQPRQPLGATDKPGGQLRATGSAAAEHNAGSSLVFRAVRSQRGGGRLGRMDPNVLTFGQPISLRSAAGTARYLSAPSEPLKHHTHSHNSTLDRSSALSGTFLDSSTASLASAGEGTSHQVQHLQEGSAVVATCSGSGNGTDLETWCLYPEHHGSASLDWGLPVAVGDVVRLAHPALGASLHPHATMAGGVQIEFDPIVSSAEGVTTGSADAPSDMQGLWRVLTPQGIARTLQGETADGSTLGSGAPQLISVGGPVLLSPLGQPHVFLSLEHGSLNLTLAPLPEFVQQELASQPLPGLVPSDVEGGSSGLGVHAAIFNAQMYISSSAAHSAALLVPPPPLEVGEGGLSDIHSAAQVGGDEGILTPAAGPAGLSVPGRFMFLSTRPHTASIPAWAVGRVQGSPAEGVLLAPASLLAPPVPLASLPAALQEAALTEDCLDVLLGFPGRYISTSLRSERAASAGMLPLNLSPGECVGLELLGGSSSTPHSGRGSGGGVDAASLALVQRIIPVAEQLWECRGFVARRSAASSGPVAQALASAVGQIVAEVATAAAQLEGQSRATGAASRGGLSLHALWFQLQPVARTVAALHSVCRSCRAAVGGALLQKLYTCWLQAGDAARRELFLFLLSCSASPFMETLGEWIFTGKLAAASRQEGAFFISENKSLTPESLATTYTSRFWEDRVTLVESQVPGFLSPHAHAILTTGKYLYALRLCGVPASFPDATKVPFATDPAAYRSLLQSALDFASQSLMGRLMVSSDLRSKLTCMKRFFLMSTGDFMTSFLEAASGELTKQVDPAAGMGLTHGGGGAQDTSLGGTEQHKTASLQRLRALLDISLRSVGGVDDDQVDAFSCVLLNSNLVDHIQAVYRMRGGQAPHPPRQASSKGPLKAYEAFTLQYHVQWPLTLVLSNASITKYQLLFRHMFFCRYVERVLCDCWQSHQEVKGLNLRATLARSYLLRQRMLHFLQNFIYYVSWEVFEPRWHEMQEGLTQCSSVDDVARVHSEFLRTCMKEALLVNDELLKLLQRLVMLCFLFANQLTNTLHACKLSPEEVDERAGITPAQAAAMRRARAARARRAEEGVAYGAGRHVSATGSARNAAQGGAAATAGGGKAPRRTLVERFDDGIEASDPDILSDVQVRTKRAAVQVAAIEHQAGQGLWQHTMEKSGEMFDRFLRSFMQKLDARAERELGSRLRQLLTRLDYNGFYSMQQALQGE